MDNVSRQSAAALDEASVAAQQRATETADILEKAASLLTTTVGTASGEVDRLVADSGSKIDQHLANLRGALAVLSDQSADEQHRIATIITEIEAHIEGSASKISEIDRAATDQTAKLAFAVSALGESTRDVGTALDNNQAITESLIERSDRLLKALANANSEIGDGYPRVDGPDERPIRCTRLRRWKRHRQTRRR